MNSYSITDLGLGPGGDWPRAIAINEKGVAVGTVDGRAMRYDGSLQTLPGPSDFSGGVAKGINDGTPEIIAGQVVPLGGGESKASLWIDGEYVDLHKQLNASYSWAVDVNDQGIVFGKADNKPFRFNTVTKEIEILSISDPAFWAQAINTHGNVVGWTILPGSLGAALLYDSTAHLLPTPGDLASNVRLDINDSNVVVGTYGTTPHAFLYDPTTTESIDIHPSSFQMSYATSINNQKQVVGTAINNLDHWATIWTPDDGTRKLNKLLTDKLSGWDLLEAYDINDKGQIVGRGTFNGQLRAFLLTAVETPASSIDLSLGELDMEVKIIWFPGGIGLRVGGDFIYPKGPPVDPDGRRELELFQRDALTGLAIQALARNISDPEARLLAEHSGTEVVRMAVAHGLPGRSAKVNNSGCLSLFLRRILMRLE